MTAKIYCYDPTATDKLSQVRGIGRYLQILRENFEKEFVFTNHLPPTTYHLTSSIFVNPFLNLLQPPVVLRRIAKKQIAVIHDLIPLKYPTHFPIGIKGKLNVFLNQLSLRNYDMIITDSVASKKDIINILRLPENKIKVIYPCLPKIFFNNKSEIRNPKSETNSNHQNSNDKNVSNFDIRASNFCLYVGDATWNKNLVNLAKAIKEINVTCVFVGKVFEIISNFKFQILNFNHPWQQEIRDFLTEVKDDKRFVFAGFVPDQELINFYTRAKCNILPSRDEGFGFSYVESASLSCPSVLSDIPILKEISKGNAIFADPNNVHDLANKIGKLYYSENARKIIGQKAYKHTQFFSSSQFKKSFIDILEKM